MDYQQFLSTLVQNIQSEYADDERLVVQASENDNRLKIKTVSLYHRGKRKTPLIYMAPFYRMYQHGYSVESIQREMKNVLEMIKDNNKIQGEIFTSFDTAALYITARVIPFEQNKEFLKMVPHRRILDMAIVYQLVFKVKENTMGAAVVYNDHCRIWNVTEDILFQAAIKGMTCRFKPVFEKIEDLISVPVGTVENTIHLYALTNSAAFFGAAVILYPGILRDIEKKIKSDFYILPSSIHEVIILAKTDETDVEQLRKIVQEVNITDSVGKDFLSNNIYIYDGRSDSLNIAD